MKDIYVLVGTEAGVNGGPMVFEQDAEKASIEDVKKFRSYLETKDWHHGKYRIAKLVFMEDDAI